MCIYMDLQRLFTPSGCLTAHFQGQCECVIRFWGIFIQEQTLTLIFSYIMIQNLNVSLELKKKD